MTAPSELIRDRRREIAERLAGVERRLAEVRVARAEWTDEEHDPEGFALTFEWQQAEGARTEHLAELTALAEAQARVDDLRHVRQLRRPDPGVSARASPRPHPLRRVRLITRRVAG